MNWGPALVSLVLVAPAVAQSPSAPNTLKGKQIGIRACVQQGTHGSMGNLTNVAALDTSARPDTANRVMYWFHKNLDGFRDHVGQTVEITGTVTDVLDSAPELRATDGVFAQLEPQAPAPVATSGTTRDSADAKPADAADAGDAPALIVKAEVNGIRMLGLCR
jgi:hypothetical protein